MWQLLILAVIVFALKKHLLPQNKIEQKTAPLAGRIEAVERLINDEIAVVILENSGTSEETKKELARMKACVEEDKKALSRLYPGGNIPRTDYAEAVRSAKTFFDSNPENDSLKTQARQKCETVFRRYSKLADISLD